MGTIIGEGVIAQEDFDSEASNPQNPALVQTWDNQQLPYSNYE